MIQKFTVRLCHLKKVSATSEFGFNIRSQTDSDCQYIGKVDKNTPAERAGLKSSDKIIEVNNKNASQLNFTELLSMIKKGLNNNPSDLLLLVVDDETDSYYKHLSDSQMMSELSTPTPSKPKRNLHHHRSMSNMNVRNSGNGIVNVNSTNNNTHKPLKNKTHQSNTQPLWSQTVRAGPSSCSQATTAAKTTTTNLNDAFISGGKINKKVTRKPPIPYFFDQADPNQNSDCNSNDDNYDQLTVPRQNQENKVNGCYKEEEQIDGEHEIVICFEPIEIKINRDPDDLSRIAIQQPQIIMDHMNSFKLDEKEQITFI